MKLGMKKLFGLLFMAALIVLLSVSALADGEPASAVDPKGDPDNPTGQSPVRFSIAGGTYDHDQTVSLFCDEGWSILYTTDGSNPSFRNRNNKENLYELYGRQYSGPITVTEDTTIKAAAYYIGELTGRVGGFSNIVEQTYHMTNPSTVTVGSVTFSPVGNSYTEAQTVTLSCPEGWNILYTTDGSEPRYENILYTYKLYGQQYSGPITVTESTIIKAAAYYIDWSDVIRQVKGFRAVGVQTYYIFDSGSDTVGNINFSPARGTYSEPQTVKLSCMNECDGILYTTDGSQPGYTDEMHFIDSVNGTRYSGPITVSESTTIMAVAYKENRMDEFGNLPPENPYTFYDVVEENYSILIVEPGSVTVSAINFFPAGETYAEPQMVTLSCGDEWDGIVYTTDGSNPEIKLTTFVGNQYSAPITVDKPTTIKALAYKANIAPLMDGSFGYPVSNIAEQTYYVYNPESVTVGAINFFPAGGTYMGPQTVTLSKAPPGWDALIYTTDGSTPGWVYYDGGSYVNGVWYDTPFTVTECCTVKAYAFKYNTSPGSPYDDTEEQTYIILTPGLSVTAPTFDPVAEGYAQPDAQPITLISTGNAAATISIVTLSGANEDCFTLNAAGGTIIAAGATDDSTYTVQPVGGLEPGTYTATITAFYDNGAKASADVGFTVTGRVAAPTFSPAPGTYPSAQQVAITCETEGASIYYTTDGSEPTTTSTLYRSPVTVAETTTLRAIAVKEGMENSEIAQAVFTIDPTGSLTELHTGENTVALDAVYQAVSFRFTPAETGAYRFRCDSESVYPSISVLDGSTRVAFRDQSPLLTGFNCAAELEGGKSYTVQLESLSGTGSIKVLVQPTALYQIYQDPATVHGAVAVDQGGVPASDESALSGAYAGSDVLLWAEPEEGYALAELRILDADGETISTGTFFAMPESDVTVSARFEKAYILSYEGDEHAEFFDIWIDGFGLGAFADREVFAGQQVEMSWTCEGDYLADGFTVTTASGSPVPYGIRFDAERNTAYLVFMMPAEDVHAVLTSRAAGFDNAAFSLPAGTRSIGESAFEGDESITTVVVPQGCQSIGKWAFRNCANLKCVRIPAGCTIGEDAFDGCVWVYLYSAENSPAQAYCAAHDNCMLMAE